VSEPLQDLSDAALAHAVEASLCAAYATFGGWPGGRVDDGAAALSCRTGLAHPLYNGVFRPRLGADGVAGQIAALMAPFAARGLPLYWWVGPGAAPADLEAHLAAAGLPYDGDVPGMAVDLAALREDRPPPRGLRFDRLDPDAPGEALAAYTRVLGVAFHVSDDVRRAYQDGMAASRLSGPGWTHYLGRLDGAPVAATSLLLAAGVAGIYNVATVPEARGRGVASALVAAALREARAWGYRAGVLQSSQAGFSVYQRLGFRKVCAFRHYVWPAALHESE
jgi:GNAT superfamily N-acetyltransferase